MGDKDLDQQLVERVQQGDKSAFDLLVRKYQHRVIKLISRYVYDRSEVEDIAQESFIKAYRAIKNFRGDSAFYTWLYRISINTAKNFLTSQSRKPRSFDIEGEGVENIEGNENLHEVDSPERKALAAEIGQTVNRVVAGLAEDLREAITLREIDGLSYEEIAKVMDCPIGTVRSRIFRAREALDAELEPLLMK